MELKDLENKVNNSSLTKMVMAIIIVGLILMNWVSCKGRNEDNQKHSQDQEALKKNITIEQNKSGELQSSIVAFQGTQKEIEQYSDSLSKEIDKLKNRKAEFITKFNTVYSVDTQYVYNNTIDTLHLSKDEYRLSWKYNDKDSTRFLEGNSIFKALYDNHKINIIPEHTIITKDEIKLDFTVGLVKNKKTGFDEIFVTPKNPNVTVGKIEGAVIDKKKKLGIDLSIVGGYGINYTNSAFRLGPFVGIAISKPLIRF